MTSPRDAISILWLTLASASVPLLLLAAASLMGLHYQRVLRRSMGPGGGRRTPHPPGASGGTELRLVPAAVSAKLGPAAGQILREAREVTKSARLAYITAALAFAAISTVFLIHSTAKLPLASRIVLPYMIIAPQVLVVTWFLRLPLRQRLSIFVGYLLVGSLLMLIVIGPVRTLGLISALIGPFVLYPLAGLYVLLSRRVQPFLVLLAASLLYVGAWVAALHLILAHPADVAIIIVQKKPWLVALGLANVFLGVILAGALLKYARSWQVMGSAALALIALAVIGAILHDSPVVLLILSGTAASVLGVLFVWLVFKIFGRLQERGSWLTPEILVAYFCWGYLTLYLIVFAWGMRNTAFSDSEWLRLGLVLAFGLYVAVLYAMFLRIRAQHRGPAARRLLLLRVFGKADEREDLLDALDDTWRRIGAVDLIAGGDVASRTLRSSMLEAFLLRHSSDQFLKTDAEVNDRLETLRSEIEGDARYPVNGVYCYGDIWKQAFMRLAQESDAVLMDVRGFTSDREGCAWELVYLVKHTALRRIVFLVDDATDREALEREARAAWADLAPDSPNVHEREPRLNSLSVDRRPEGEKISLFKLLLSAAFEDSAGLNEAGSR